MCVSKKGGAAPAFVQPANPLPCANTRAPTTILSPPSSLPKSWSVPQRWFLHFYVLGVATTTAVLAAYARFLSAASGGGGGGGGSWWRWGAAATPAAPALSPPRSAAVAALALLWLHLARRLVECVAVTRWPRGARMHGLAYLFSMR